MKKIKFDWENIIEMGKSLGIPSFKKRAILREYLQCHFLKYLYQQKESSQVSFIGGTSLRVLHNLDRFSEDLDFDNLGLKTIVLERIFKNATKKLIQEGFDLEFKFKKVRENIWRGYLKFGGGLLKEVKLSPLKEEKLMIKIEMTKPDYPVFQKVFLLNRFGVIETVVSNTLETILSQKSLAIIYRKPARARDFYDVVWLLSKGVYPNFLTLKKVKIKNLDDYKKRMLERYSQIKPKLKSLKKQLLPFLINEENIKYLDLFDRVIEGLDSSNINNIKNQ